MRFRHLTLNSLDFDNINYLLILEDPKCLKINVDLQCFESDTKCINSRFVQVILSFLFVFQSKQMINDVNFE